MARPKKWDDAHTHTVRISGRAEKAWRATGLSFGDWVEGLIDRKGAKASDSEHMHLRNLEAQRARLDEEYTARKEALDLQIEALTKRQGDKSQRTKDEVRDVLDRAKGRKPAEASPDDEPSPQKEDDEQED